MASLSEVARDHRTLDWMLLHARASKWMEESMGLCIDSQLLYKSLSEAKVIKMAERAMGAVQTERKKYKCIYHTEEVQSLERLR